MFWSHEPVAWWQTDAWLEEMRRSLRPNQFLRMIENRFVTTESSFVDMAAWDRCVDPRLGHAVNDPGLPIWVGVDASIKHDCTAIVATTWDQQGAAEFGWLHIAYFSLVLRSRSISKRRSNGPCSTCASAFCSARCCSIPSRCKLLHNGLREPGYRLEEFPQSPSNLTTIAQNLFEFIRGQNLFVYPDRDIRLAISRAVARETPRGWRITKQVQSHKIDLVIALAMAAHAAIQGQSEHYYNTNMDAWVGEGVDWQGLRTNLYVRSGGTFRLF